MCLIAFAIQACERWPVVIASNRDEFFHRPSLPLARWQGPAGHTVVSGRDALAGGSWLGINTAGRVAFLTNVRAGPASSAATYPKSRGELVTRWLDGDVDLPAFLRNTAAGDYAGFNLVLGDWTSGHWAWASNRPDPAAGAESVLPGNGQLYTRTLGPGIYGLSNASLDTPWPKTVALKDALAETLLAASDSICTDFPEDRLWAALASRAPAVSQSLTADGMTLLERGLSSAFVEMPERDYGTRSSTLLVAGMTNSRKLRVRVQEKTYQRPARYPGAAATVGLALDWPAAGPAQAA
ncbi:MAG: hypothetical protein JWQ72_1702 [Polaromonas sp.]|nr:hypothetical protein [Polaromonas sp.]